MGKIKDSLIDETQELMDEENVLLDKEYFHFDEAKHIYYLGGKPLYGVTSILDGTLAKPALVQWSSDQACNYASANINSNTEYSEEELTEIFKEARVAHRKTKEKAGTHGTDIHQKVEDYINHCINTNNGNPTPNDDKDIQPFIDWATQENVRFIESEKRLYSKIHWYAGTTDFIYEKDGQMWIGDVKTSKAIYWSYFLQMGAYDIAYEEMTGKRADGRIIIRLGKDGSFETQVSKDRERDTQGFLSALTLFKISKTWN